MTEITMKIVQNSKKMVKNKVKVEKSVKLHKNG